MKKIDLRRVDLNLLLVFETLMQEASVSRAAEKLGRTQSAVSHALARLREQLGDPLLVKVGGRMQASPYAHDLEQEVRPILRRIEHVLAPKVAFVPGSSTRRFRVGVPDVAAAFVALLMTRIRQEAPGVMLEWLLPREHMLSDVAEAHLDLACLPDGVTKPEGVTSQALGELAWLCAMRKDHPALTRWSSKQWAAWPHLVVGVGDRQRNPVTEAAHKAGVSRRIAVSLPTFGAVAPMLAQTDLIATLPSIVLHDAALRYDLVLRPMPFPIASMTMAVYWSTRMSNDPATRWLRDVLVEVFATQLKAK